MELLFLLIIHFMTHLIQEYHYFNLLRCKFLINFDNYLMIKFQVAVVPLLLNYDMKRYRLIHVSKLQIVTYFSNIRILLHFRHINYI